MCEWVLARPEWSMFQLSDVPAGPHAARHGDYGANACGWSTQLVATAAAFAVPGEPRCRRPIPQIKLLGRRNLRRLELTTLEATYLEAVISFDQLNTFDEYKYGPVWEQAPAQDLVQNARHDRRGPPPDPARGRARVGSADRAASAGPETVQREGGTDSGDLRRAEPNPKPNTTPLKPTHSRTGYST